MADFETKLRWLSERGNPVGAEELIERIEADLAGDPLVVVTKRREGIFMTKTQQPPATVQPSRYKGPAWAAAAFAIVLALGGLYLAFAGSDGEVADQTTVPAPTTVPTVTTTMSPDVETMTDLQIIEAGVEALYSGDIERAVELFELPAPNDDAWIRSEASYQASIGGRLTLDCTEEATSGAFTCHVPYANVFTDAIGWINSPGDSLGVVVEDGVITEFGLCQSNPSRPSCPDGIPVSIFTGERVSGFPDHFFISEGLAGYLSLLGSGNPDCVYDRYPDAGVADPSASIECLQAVLDDLDGWATWAKTNLELPPS